MTHCLKYGNLQRPSLTFRGRHFHFKCLQGMSEIYDNLVTHLILQEFFTQIFVQHMASKNPTMVEHWQTKNCMQKRSHMDAWNKLRTNIHMDKSGTPLPTSRQKYPQIPCEAFQFFPPKKHIAAFAPLKNDTLPSVENHKKNPRLGKNTPETTIAWWCFPDLTLPSIRRAVVTRNREPRH